MVRAGAAVVSVAVEEASAAVGDLGAAVILAEVAQEEAGEREREISTDLITSG